MPTERGAGLLARVFRLLRLRDGEEETHDRTAEHSDAAEQEADHQSSAEARKAASRLKREHRKQTARLYPPNASKDGACLAPLGC